MELKRDADACWNAIGGDALSRALIAGARPPKVGVIGFEIDSSKSCACKAIAW